MEDMEKKEMELRAIFEKLKKVPEDKLDYAAGVVDGLSIAYDSMFGVTGKTA